MRILTAELSREKVLQLFEQLGHLVKKARRPIGRVYCAQVNKFEESKILRFIIARR